MIVRLIVQTFIWFGAMGILLFGGRNLRLARRLDLISSSWLRSASPWNRPGPDDPGLFRGRMGWPVQRDQPAADKMLLVALLLFMFAWLVLMGLDAKRFSWSSSPALMQALGAGHPLVHPVLLPHDAREQLRGSSDQAPAGAWTAGDLDRTLRLRSSPDVFRRRFLLHWRRAAARLMVGRHIRFRPDRPPLHPYSDRGKGVARAGSRAMTNTPRMCAIG